MVILWKLKVLIHVGINNLNLKKEVDGIDYDDANWYNVCDLSRENLSPFAIYSVEKMEYKLK